MESVLEKEANPNQFFDICHGRLEISGLLFADGRVIVCGNVQDLYEGRAQTFELATI